ncbi:MAG: hypothetical protein JRG76_18920 [Deltaproteobacteria bacterium]|nr:hypothetical protein [Deltaproteobacteria bacterium]
MRKTRRALLCLLLPLVGCATARTDDDVNRLVNRTLDSARAHARAGQVPEAAVLLRGIERVSPEAKGVDELWNLLGDAGRAWVDRGAMGMNRRVRVPVERSTGERILYYPLDRLADLADIVSFSVSLGAGVEVKAHVTRGLQAGFGGKGMSGIGWMAPRIAGTQQELEIGVAFLHYEQTRIVGRRHGSPGGVTTGFMDMTGLQSTSAGFYQDYRDFWGVGASVALVLAGASAEIHPVQLFDFITGFLGVDIAHDDGATTRGLFLTDDEEQALIELNEVEQVRSYK